MKVNQCRFVLSVVCLLTALASSMQAATITLNSVADTYTRSGVHAGLCSGREPDSCAGARTSPCRRSKDYDTAVLPVGGPRSRRARRLPCMRDRRAAVPSIYCFRWMRFASFVFPMGVP